MKINRVLILILAILVIFLICILAVLQYSDEHNDTTKPIIITGSSVLTDPVTQTCREWQNLTPIAVRVEAADSSIALRDVNRRGVDIAMLSRPLTWAETSDYPDLVLTPIGYDTIALVVSNSNIVLSLSEDQIRRIFSGQIKDWGEVGGIPGRPIQVLGREPGASSRDFFRKAGLKTNIYGENIQEYSSDDDIVKAIRGDLNGTMIAYLPLSKVTGDIRTVYIKTSAETIVEPTLESVSDGDYPYVRTLYLVTLPDARGDVQALITFISSPFGREILKKNGILPYETSENGTFRINIH
jgi:phosphate transport system substrate-binding protein